MSKKEVVYSKVRDYVYKSIEHGLMNGWFEFKDKSMNIDTWTKLSEEEKEKYPVKLTEKGKKEGSDFEKVLNIYQSREKIKDFEKTLIKDVNIDKDNNIIFELTEDGKLMRTFCDSLGMDFLDFLKGKLTSVIDKLFSGFIVLNKKENIIKGQVRIK